MQGGACFENFCMFQKQPDFLRGTNRCARRVNCLRSSDNIAAVNSNTRLLPIYSVETLEKTIAITFDSAWEDADTADILAVLAKYNAKATFFVTGDYLDRCGASAKAFFDAGHEIANHSDQHPHPNKLSREALEADTKSVKKKSLP